MDRPANINETIRRSLTLQKSRNSTLAQEKADLEADIKVPKQQLSKVANGSVITVNNELDETEKTEDEIDNKRAEIVVSPGSKDPNRPRFTLKELQRVLQEKNDLKEKVLMLEIIEGCLRDSRQGTLFN